MDSPTYNCDLVNTSKIYGKILKQVN